MNCRHFFRIKVNSQLFTYALLQVAVGGSALLRVPLIIGQSGLSVASQFLLFISVLAWAPLIVSGVVNRTRVSFIQSGNIYLARTGRINKTTLSLLIAITSVVLAIIAGQIILASCLAVAVGLLVPISYAPYFGLQQGRGLVNNQNLTAALAACLGLLLTFLSILSKFWRHLSEQEQVFTLVAISVVTTSVPYIVAFMRYRKSEFITRSAETQKLSLLKIFSRMKFLSLESVATLPPSLLGLVDVMALSIFREQEDVIAYGLTQRIAVIATFLTGALYLQESNKTISEPNFQGRIALNRSVKLAFKNLPFIVLFLLVTPWLVSMFSQNKVSASFEFLCTFGLLAVGQAFWVIFSSYVYKNSNSSQDLGRFVLYFLLPMSVILTFGGALVFGVSGPVLASFLCYTFAILYSVKLSRRESDV